MPYRKENRLRHVLYLGTIMAKQAQAFYRKFAGRVEDDRIQAVFSKLADDKSIDSAFLEKELSRMKPMPISRMELDILDVDGQLRNLFGSPPEPASRPTDLVVYALEQEGKMASLFDRLFAERINPWKSVGIEDTSTAKVERLKGLFDQGKDHIQQLTELLALLNTKYK